jgi:adenylate cyclase
MSETRKLAAILVADVVGYSRLAGNDEDRTLARLRGLRSDLIDPAIAAHRGRIVKRTGDGSIIEFRSVVDAVRCAIEIQNGLIERNAGVPDDRRIEFRVGIHVGDVVEESDGDLMGDGVNIAARLEGIAAPGAICPSEDAYRQVSGRLEMEVTDLGLTHLKNIDRQIRAYSLQVGVPAKPKPAEPVTPAALTPQKRRFGLALAAALAALMVVIAGGAWWFFNASRPAGVAAKAPAEAARLSIVVLPFANLSGSGAGLPRRRPDRRSYHQSRDYPRHLRHRAQHGHDLQRQASRRQGDRQGSGRALSSRRLGAAERRSDEG